MKNQRGMSLIEVMVAVVIGLIGCVVIFQMYSVAEVRKRTVASGSDMDIAGRLALMTLERDVQLAGYGFGMAAAWNASLSGSLLGCQVVTYDNQRPVASQDFTYTFAPVVIGQGTAGAPDTIAILKGSSDLLVIGKVVQNGTATTIQVKADTGGRSGVRRGDIVIEAYRSATVHECGMFEITGDTNSDELTLDHEPLTSYTTALGVTKSTRYNKTGGTSFALTMGEGKLYNLGPSPARSVWSIRPPGVSPTDPQGGKLVVTNDLAFTDMNSDGQNDLLEAADLIINLQAQYGVDANNDGMISDTEWTTTAPTQWERLLAVRFALLTRGQQWERDQVTTTAPSWSEGAFVMTNVDGTADTNPTGAEVFKNWRHYRYKVFEAVVPLRNILIGKQTI